MPNSHMWLQAAALDSTGIEQIQNIAIIIESSIGQQRSNYFNTLIGCVVSAVLDAVGENSELARAWHSTEQLC